MILRTLLQVIEAKTIVHVDELEENGERKCLRLTLADDKKLLKEHGNRKIKAIGTCRNIYHWNILYIEVERKNKNV